MIPYDEQQHRNKTGLLLAADYKEAPGRFVGDDDDWVVWPARVERDVCEGMSYDDSIAKHRREWREKLGLDPGRAPLPPFPEPINYSTVLPFAPPAVDRNFLRANAWSVEVPDAPVVPRGPSRTPNRVLTYLLYAYPQNFWANVFRAHQYRKYTHFVLSWPDARDAGNWTLSGFRALCQVVRSEGFYVHVKLLAKPVECGNDIQGDPKDMPFDQIRAYVDPIFDGLYGVVDEYGVWEWNLWNLAGDTTVQALKHMGQRSHEQGATFWQHYSTHVTWWGTDGTDRFNFYKLLGKDVDGLDYQSHPDWSINELQGRLADSQIQFAQQGFGHKIRLFEESASKQWDNPSCTEDIGDMRSFLGLCSASGVPVYGYGNGGRRPDGTPL